MMRDDVRQALAIGPAASIAERTIDITTTGRRSGAQRRIEICFHRVGDDLYLSGIPTPKRRDWLANLSSDPHFVFHLKNGVVADLDATAAEVTDPDERRRVFGPIVENYNARWQPDGPFPRADLDGWVARSPLALISFDDAG